MPTHKNTPVHVHSTLILQGYCLKIFLSSLSARTVSKKKCILLRGTASKLLVHIRREPNHPRMIRGWFGSRRIWTNSLDADLRISGGRT